uniref:C-type lectin domain-containing protein n=1 Tax=Heterorhabditis bacteriophora TaxID=37862 RepID=A0A1I7XSY0_HETBA
MEFKEQMNLQGFLPAILSFSIFYSSLSFKFSSDEQVVLTVPRPKLRHDISSHHSTEWIKGPDEFLYQFHVGEQSWIAAREYCLAQNSDLVVLRDMKQMVTRNTNENIRNKSINIHLQEWLLSHYAPTYSRFAERFLQIGLMLPEGHSREWVWLDGRKDEQKIVGWTSGEPFDHSTDGRERCALLRIHERKLDDVDCDENAHAHHKLRFVCERSYSGHSQQQKTDNFIWAKIEQLFEYFGIGKITSKPASAKDEENYWDEIDNAFYKQLSLQFKNQTISSSERSDLAKIHLNESKNSKEEQEEVDGILHKLSQATTTRNKYLEKHTLVDQITESSGEEFRSPQKLAPSQVVSLIELENKGEGSGVNVDRKSIEQDANELLEIDTPEKLEKVIISMEKMIASLENITVKNTEIIHEKKTEEKEEQKNEENDRNIHMNREVIEGDKMSIDARPKSEPINKSNQSDDTDKSGRATYQMDSGVTSNTVSDNLEKDFDEEHNQGMPVSDITPLPEEECDEEEGRGENFVNKKRGETEELSQKPKIPAEREGHVREFLATLRLFLERAEHNDLRKLLDDDSGKTLLDKMKDAIIAANQREFYRMELLQDMKIKGEDISKIEEPHFMGIKEREDLYKKISGVVITEAEKEELESVTKSSVRTTTEENIKPNKSRILTIEDKMIRLDVDGTNIETSSDSEISGEEKKEEKLKQDEAGIVKKKNKKTMNIIFAPTGRTIEKNSDLAEQILESKERKTTKKDIINGEKEFNTIRTFTSSPEMRNTIRPPLSTIVPNKKGKIEGTIGKVFKEMPRLPELEGIEDSVLYNSTPPIKLEGAMEKELDVGIVRSNNDFNQRMNTSMIISAIKRKEEENSRMNPTNTFNPTNSVNGLNSLPTLEKVLKNLGQQFKKLLSPLRKSEFLH